jgi:hypothetical protein
MARNHAHNHDHAGHDETQSAAAATEATEATEAAPEAAPEEASRGNKIYLTNGEGRAEYIRRRFKAGVSRGAITKEVNALMPPGSKPVPYQIIFAATKGMDKPAAAAPAATEAAPEAPAEDLEAA